MSFRTEDDTALLLAWYDRHGDTSLDDKTSESILTPANTFMKTLIAYIIETLNLFTLFLTSREFRRWYVAARRWRGRARLYQ